MKGVSPSTRKSRRFQGMEPEEIDVDEFVGNEGKMKDRKKRDVMNLLRKGGRGGRFVASCSNWEYFPALSNKFATREERQKHNENVFQPLHQKEVIEIANENEEMIQEDCTHQILHMKHLEDTINQQCWSKCCIDQQIDDFIQFCCRRNVLLSHKHLSDL